MELLGKHRITFDKLRSRAIQCHALGLSAYHLFHDSTHFDKTGKTKAIYEELYTSQLLGLAIALRTKFYQGLDYKKADSYVSPCALMYKYTSKGEENQSFSMKDICDKIIHADSVSLPLEKDIEKPMTILREKIEVRIQNGNLQCL